MEYPMRPRCARFLVPSKTHQSSLQISKHLRLAEAVDSLTRCTPTAPTSTSGNMTIECAGHTILPPTMAIFVDRLWRQLQPKRESVLKRLGSPPRSVQRFVMHMCVKRDPGFCEKYSGLSRDVILASLREHYPQYAQDALFVGMVHAATIFRRIGREALCEDFRVWKDMVEQS